LDTSLVRSPVYQQHNRIGAGLMAIARGWQLIKCSPTSFTQWKRKLAAKSQTSAFFRVQTSEPTTDSIEIKLPSGISILFKVTVNCK
jgi:hypothetical protein